MKRFILFALLSIAVLLAGCATTTPPPAAAVAPAAAPAAMPALSDDDMVASNGTDSVRLTQQPCPPAILAMVPPQVRGRSKAAMASVQGQRFSACWYREPGAVVLQYEDGDQGMVPLSEFRRVPKA